MRSATVGMADTLEGLTDLHEILAAVVRAALADEAMALGLQHRIDAMGKRLDRLTYRAATRRELARDVMIDSGIKKVAASDLTLIVRPGNPSVLGPTKVRSRPIFGCRNGLA